MPKGLKRALKAARQEDSEDEVAAAEERDGKQHTANCTMLYHTS
jgi:hypothetical protein